MTVEREWQQGSCERSQAGQFNNFTKHVVCESSSESSPVQHTGNKTELHLRYCHGGPDYV